MSDDEPDTDLPEDGEGMYERLVSHDSAEGSVPSVDFVNRLAERQQYMSNNPDRDYMQTHPRDRIYYFEPPVGKWTLAKLMRSPLYCFIALVSLLPCFLFGYMLGDMFPLLGILGCSFLLYEIYKCVRSIGAITPPTP